MSAKSLKRTRTPPAEFDVRFGTRLRIAFAIAVVGAYVLPLTVGIASQASHELDHLVEELRGHELGAVAEVEHEDEDEGAAPDGFVHAHGDVAAHAHEGGVAMLLVAAERNEQQQSDAAVVALELVGHVPAAGGPAVVFAADASAVARWAGSPATDISLSPPLPPPRA